MLRSLRTCKGRRNTGLFLVEGRRLCEELLQSPVSVECVLVSASEKQNREISILAGRFARADKTVLQAPAREIQRVSDTVHSQGIVVAARWENCEAAELHFGRRAVVLALDRVSDPGNLGAIIRTAAWFGVTAVLLGEGCADLLNPKTVRATMGGLFHLPICRGVSLPVALDGLKRKAFRIAVAAADGSSAWRSWAGSPRAVLVLGSEAHGVSPTIRDRADAVLAVPRQRGGKGESLNVAVTAGIFLAAAAE